MRRAGAKELSGRSRTIEKGFAMQDTLISYQRGAVSVLQFNRPSRRNAIDSDLLDHVDQKIRYLKDRAEIRAIILVGDESAFSSGQDLKEVTPPDYLDRFNEVVNLLERTPKLTIAAISGWCIAGGLEFALACDLRIASESAKIGDFHGKINSIGGGGATARLPRLIGLSRAKHLIYTAETISAHDAYRIGLVDAISTNASLLDSAIALAQAATTQDESTFVAAKLAMHDGLDLSLEEAVRESLERHKRHQNARLSDSGA